MFQINDYIVYSGTGVCKVNSIGPLNLEGANKDKKYYTLEPVYKKGNTLYTPVDNQKVVMRKILSKEETEKLIENIPNIDIILITDEKEREKEYKELIKKNDCTAWVKIIKSMYMREMKRIAEGKKITNTDKKYLNMAEESLYGELAIPLEIPKEEVEEYITSKIEELENCEKSDNCEKIEKIELK
jgi:CarD family transcriptional regulator